MPENFAALLAELIGTFAFFFIGAGAICVDARLGAAGPGLLGIAAAHGIMLGVMVSALGHISGGHFNPAVTFGLALGRKISPGRAVQYVVAQLVGGAIAGFLLAGFFPEARAAAPFLGTPDIAPGMGVGSAILLEAILTFFLVTVVYATAVDPRGAFGKIAGFAIGLTVMMDILVGGPLTGAAMNPARHFATAIASGHWHVAWIYWVGPLLGGGVAGLLYSGVFLPKER